MSIVDTHLTLGNVGEDESKSTSRDVQIREYDDDDIVVNPVECLAKTAVDSLWLLSIFLWMNGPT